MKHLLLMLCAMVLSTGLYAQSTEIDESEQVLVFRHSGEVNLFYVSELDSIVLSNYDADSIRHDEIVSQLFYAQDTTLLVPIAEIDSVAFGSRNEMVLNSAVRELFDDIDFPWIIRTEDNSIFYRKDTPENILPKIGDKLYYAGTNDLMPMGLAAKVVSVAVANEEIAVTLENAELNEIFDKLFYAGRIAMGMDNAEAKGRAPKAPEGMNNCVPLEENLDFGNFGELSVKGKTELEGNFVARINRSTVYCSASINGDTSFGFEWSLASEESTEFRLASPRFSIPIPLYGGVIRIIIYADVFIEGKAELSINYSMQRNHEFGFEWTYKNGKSTFKNREPSGEDEQDNDEAKIEVVLNGELYAGAELGVEINALGDRAGLDFNLKAGPYLKGELGFGILQDLRNYNPQFTYNANLDMGLKLNFNVSTFWLDCIFWGDRETHPIYNHDFILFKHSLPLFPEYEDTRAVKAVAKETKEIEKTEISVATKVENEILHEVEQGFEVINKEGEVVDSIFVEEPVLADETEAQEFATTIELIADSLAVPIDPKEDSLFMRPIFKYAGYTISAAPVNVMHDSNIMPITTYNTNGVSAYIAGASVIGSAKNDGIVYHVGNYLPVPMTLYKKKRATVIFTQGWHISNKKNITGTWIGEHNGADISLTFNDGDECSGTYVVGNEARPFTYNINTPQSGDIQLLFDDESTIVITIISVNDTTLKYRNKNEMEDYELNKQY